MTVKQENFVSISEMILRGVYGKSYDDVLREATNDAERILSLDSKGWLAYGTQTNNLDVVASLRTYFVQRSRRYFAMDPLAKQAIRLWTDYTFGSGISVRTQEEVEESGVSEFWDSKANRRLLSAQGQRKSSDKLLVDGEVFFVIFKAATAAESKLRWIDPLEITDIVTDPNDIETPMYYKREWTDTLGASHVSYYCSIENESNEATFDAQNKLIQATADADGAFVYHLFFNTIGQRGNPLLLPVLDWIDEYRKFLAARIAIVRALSRFALKTKIKGGTSAVAASKALTEGKLPAAGSRLIENEATDTNAMEIKTGAADASEDGRMIKLQICAGLGIPEQYFGDIATGNLATAKTVELPLLKQFASYQQLWADAYSDIISTVVEDDVELDIDFPEIAPNDIIAAMTAIQNLVTAFPDYADSEDVQKQALLNIGLNNVQDIIDAVKLIKQANDQKREENKAKMPQEMQNQDDSTQQTQNSQNEQEPGENNESMAFALVRLTRTLRQLKEAFETQSDAAEAKLIVTQKSSSLEKS